MSSPYTSQTTDQPLVETPAAMNYEQKPTWPTPLTPEDDRETGLPPSGRSVGSGYGSGSSEASSSPIEIRMPRRPRSAGKSHSRTLTARSHYSTRSQEVRPDDQPEYTASAAEVRQQTLSWTYRELNQPSLSSSRSVGVGGLSRRKSGAGEQDRSIRPIRVMSADSLQQLVPGKKRVSLPPIKGGVSQLSALRQLALSIEQSAASDDEQQSPKDEYEYAGHSDYRSQHSHSHNPNFADGHPGSARRSSAANKSDRETGYESDATSPPHDVVYDMSAYDDDDDDESGPLLPSSNTPVQGYGPANYNTLPSRSGHGKTATSGYPQCWFPKPHIPSKYVKAIKDFQPRDLITWSGLVVATLPAVVLGVILNLLDAVSYGSIVFPGSDSNIPDTARQAGISTFFASTVIAQLVYSLGGSGFKGVNGSMMIEVMPFLHIMCTIIEDRMKGQPSNAILATIMVSYAMSTILTGLVFLLLGMFRLGNLIQFFPRHILVGCIGGIGLFLIYTGVEVTSGVPTEPANPQYYLDIFSPSALRLWGTSLALAVLLKLMQRRVTHALFVPMYYVVVPVIFYIVVLSAGIPIQQLRDDGWLFGVPGGKQAPFWTYWTYFDMRIVDWGAIPATIPTQLALTFFGILHVPINVPALAVSTRQDIDVNREIIGHGISNLASGFIGSLQNYLVYSNSVLYIRSGGNSRLGGLMLAFATAGVWVAGGTVVGYVPTIVVGSLIFHLGIDLLKESVVDTWNIGIHPLEYLTILLIVGIMGFFGFTEGIVAGIILACVFFVVMYSRRSVIRASFTGAQLRSTVHRLYRQQMFLDQVGDQIHIIKLQGFMFFGTINQLDDYMRDTLHDHPRIRFIVVDFSLISGIDYSALETFLRIKRMLKEQQTHLVFSGLGNVGRELAKSGIFTDEDDESEEEGSGHVHNFGNLNEALEWCENRLLAIYYKRRMERGGQTERVDIPRERSASGSSQNASNPPSYPFHHPTPREKQAFQAASLVLRENPPNSLANTSTFHPVSILMQAFSEASSSADYAHELAEFCENRFERMEIKRGTVLWMNGDDAKELFVVEAGELVLVIPDQKELKVVETLLPGTMVGELEMFSDRPRSCRLIANDDSVVWQLSKATFDEMAEENPRLMLKFVTKVAVSFDASIVVMENPPKDALAVDVAVHLDDFRAELRELTSRVDGLAANSKKEKAKDAEVIAALEKRIRTLELERATNSGTTSKTMVRTDTKAPLNVPVAQVFKFGQKLGSGGFGDLYLVSCKRTGDVGIRDLLLKHLDVFIEVAATQSVDFSYPALMKKALPRK
ncbi:hypothetical protein HDV00_011510 [Rhizophlyctis rosea]|nr:hypothetical protein HDV00_011510 [Rhizophlyctis rosea]